MNDKNLGELLHKEYHWKDGAKYLLEYFKTLRGVKSRMTKVEGDKNDR